MEKLSDKEITATHVAWNVNDYDNVIPTEDVKQFIKDLKERLDLFQDQVKRLENVTIAKNNMIGAIFYQLRTDINELAGEKLI